MISNIREKKRSATQSLAHANYFILFFEFIMQQLLCASQIIKKY
jgi:hypothetical protein